MADYSVFDHLLEGYQVIDADFRYLYVNETAMGQGRADRDLRGRTMPEAYPGIENTPLFGQIRACLASGQPQSLENPFVYADGTSAWFLLKITPVPEGVLILSVDISAQKRSEEELRRQVEKLEALREIDVAIVSTTDPTFALRTILERVTTTLRVDAADVLLLNPYTNFLEFAAGRGFHTKGIEKSLLLLGQGHAGRAAAQQTLLFVSDLDARRSEFLRWNLIEGEGFASFVVVPLVARGNLLGVLEVFHRQKLAPDAAWFEFLEALGGQSSIAIESGQLFRDLKHSHRELGLAYETTLEGWSRALDLRDKETEGHTLRVTERTMALARAAGLPPSQLVHVRRGALLHDIGKMGIPDSILLKPGPLTPEEWAIMRRHPIFAKELLSPIEYLRPCLAIPYSHHEKYDGTGYPLGLKGDQISLEARLFSVVDVWDALRFDRPYRRAWTEVEVFHHLKSLAGSHFDPWAVDLFFRVGETGS